MRRHTLAIAAAFLLLFIASDVAPPPRAQGSGEAALPLSLAECLRMALDRNLDLVSARRDPQIAEQDVIIRDADFDPTLGARGSHRENKGEPSNIFTPEKSTTDSVDATFGQKLGFGADYAITYGLGKTDAEYNRYNPAYTGYVTLGWSMPLLRGFGNEPTQANLLLARTNREISAEDLRRQAHVTIKEVVDAYWDLAAVRAALDVARQTLKLAQDLYDLNKKKVEVGTLAPIEITQAEAGVASREEGVIRAENALRNAEDNLRRLLGVPKDDPLWVREIVPTDAPDSTDRAVDLDAALTQALEARPELVSARKNLRNLELRERVAQNAIRHGLDLEASVTSGGNNLIDTLPGPDLNGDGFPDIDIPVVGGLGDAIEESPKFRNYDWAVGLTYSFPIGNRAAKANRTVAALNREKGEIGIQNLEQSIRVDVRTAARNVESGYKRIKAAQANNTLQKKNVEAEQKKYENGMSTSFQVLQIQNDLANAQLSLIQAVLDYNKSLADLERAKGTLLEAEGFQLADVEAKR